MFDTLIALEKRLTEIGFNQFVWQEIICEK